VFYVSGPEGATGRRAGLPQEDQLWRRHDGPEEEAGAAAGGGNAHAHT